ncbi:MAG: hypothetical protein WD960_04535 [Gemmatimonadota bacterium]
MESASPGEARGGLSARAVYLRFQYRLPDALAVVALLAGVA